MSDFKLHKDCKNCKKLKKECKGIQFSVNVLSFYCPKMEEKGK
ncbi:hypothetical protein [Terrisporobacter sp.]|nr:MAG TPA: hypothetical protein [Caudoviricetes sp.]